MNSLDSILSELINRSEGILSYQSLPILISLTLSMESKNHVVLKAKIQFQHTHLNLTKLQNSENFIDKLASYPFPEIELEHECYLEPQIDNSIPLFISMLTPESLPHFKRFPKSALNFVPIHREIITHL